MIVLPLEPQFLYSNRSYWYPQSPVTDYATAKLTITVPGEYDVVASGTPQGAGDHRCRRRPGCTAAQEVRVRGGRSRRATSPAW